MVFDISNPWVKPARKVTKGKPKGFKKVTWGMSKISTPERYTAPRTGGGGGRLKKISRSKSITSYNIMKSNPNLKTANKIRKNLGLKVIFPHVERRRRGRWSNAKWSVSSENRSKSTRFRRQVASSESPEVFLTEYYRKTSLVDWAKTKGLKLAETDTGKFRTGSFAQPNYWTHNSRKRLVGYSEKTKYRIGKPLNKDQEISVLYQKLVKKSNQKKKRFVKLYKPLDVDLREKLKTSQGEEKAQIENQLNYVRYSYYGITDKELTESEKYKTNLITEIKQTDKVTDDMKRGINQDPDADKSDETYKKMLIEDLEKEYEKEQKDFEQTSTEVQKRETVFAQSSTIVRPNQRIVKLATQNRQPIQRQSKSNPNSIPLSIQRGQGFKRFARW